MSKVAICTPCGDSVRSGFALDLANLFAYSLTNGVDCTLRQNRGTILPMQRAELVQSAFNAAATHVLFVDSDMRFPHDALVRLVTHNQPIVGANYPRRRHPAWPTASTAPKELLYTEPDSEGFVEVKALGFGFVLIALDVFREVSQPWFNIGFMKDTNGYVGEDVFFCQRVKDLGFKVLVDQDLSKEIRHTGELDYTHVHCLQTRDHFKPKIELLSR